MKLTLSMVSLTAAGLIAIPPVSIAHGISAGHMPAVETHDNDRNHDRFGQSQNTGASPASSSQASTPSTPEPATYSSCHVLGYSRFLRTTALGGDSFDYSRTN